MSEPGGRTSSLVYPAPVVETLKDQLLGIYPVDFMIEVVIAAGLKWFRETPEAPNSVFGHLAAPFLSVKYGQKKIDEIANFIRKTDIRIVQHWSLIDQVVPNISIQLLDATEREDRAALDDHAGDLDVVDDADGAVLGREQIGYAPIVDNVHIGIHAVDTPDLTKYIYYLVIYILSAFKPQLQEKGLGLTTFRATDISRLNDYLPNNMFSRFINFSVYTTAPFKKDSLPMLEEIVGATFTGEDDGTIDEISGGITATEVQQSDGE